MPNPLLLDIALFLTAAGVVIGDGIDTFRDIMPEQPDTAISLQEYAGDPGSPVDEAVNRSVQVISRSSNADTARQLAKSIYATLRAAQRSDGFVQFTVDRWGQVYIRQPPFFFKRDENNRTYYAFNLGITTTIE